MTGTPNGQPTGSGYGPVYDQLIADRNKMIAEFKAYETRHRGWLADIDAAVAAVVARQPAPAAPQVERLKCAEPGCFGYLVPGPNNVLVHDASGEIACFPGHSGPVGHPMEQTKSFPQVANNGVTQVIPAVPPAPIIDPDCRDGKHGSCMGGPCKCFHHVYAHLVGQQVGVVLADEARTEIWGELEGTDGRGLAVVDARGLTNTVDREAIAHVLLHNGALALPHNKPADLDQATATPAAQEAGQADG